MKPSEKISTYLSASEVDNSYETRYAVAIENHDKLIARLYKARDYFAKTNQPPQRHIDSFKKLEQEIEQSDRNVANLVRLMGL